jgi:hypothetical protein
MVVSDMLLYSKQLAIIRPSVGEPAGDDWAYNGGSGGGGCGGVTVTALSSSSLRGGDVTFIIAPAQVSVLSHGEKQKRKK